MFFKMRFILFLCLIVYSYALIDVTIDQSVSNVGFHRSLSSNITIYGNLSSCYLVVEEKFPNNLFLQDHELDDFSNKGIGIKLSMPVNSEATATNALPFSLYLYLNNSLPVTTSNEFSTTFFYDLKIHIRYHDPRRGGGIIDFKKLPAVLYARCPVENSLPVSKVVQFPCSSTVYDLCDWHAIPTTHKNTLPSFSLPVGNIDLYQAVFLSTHISAYTGVFYLLYSLFSMPIH